MKVRILKISTILLLFVMMGAGCENESSLDNNQEEKDSIYEISLSSKDTVIQKSIDGIDFKFCLLNEDGEPATVFNEGENFSFYFSAINNRENSNLYFDMDFIYRYPDVNFCKVFDAENQDLGRPYKLLTPTDIGIYYPFDLEQSYTFEVSWTENRDFIWWCEGGGASQSLHRTPLIKGKYYTGFKYQFRFSRKHGEPALYIDINFRINFVIQ